MLVGQAERLRITFWFLRLSEDVACRTGSDLMFVPRLQDVHACLHCLPAMHGTTLRHAAPSYNASDPHAPVSGLEKC